MTGHNLYVTWIRLILLPCFCWGWMGMDSFAQKDKGMTADPFNNAHFKNDSSDIILYYTRPTGCKTYAWDSVLFPNPNKQEVILEKYNTWHPMQPQPSHFLQLHGNIAYSFDYRSQVDTPFASTNLQQHTEQVYADATLKGKYPFRVILNSRQSNSPFFRNYTDLNIEFRHQAFQQSVRDSMIAAMIKRIKTSDSLNKYQQLLNRQKSKYAALTNWIADPARKQEIVQEKEQLYHQALLLAEQRSGASGVKDSIRSLSAHASNPLSVKIPDYLLPAKKDSSDAQNGKKDSLLALMQQPGATEKKMQSERKRADSLYKEILGTRHLTDSAHAKEDSIINSYVNQIRNARSVGELEEISKKTGSNGLTATDKKLLAVTHFGIGRSSVNYSDLTVSNISLTGVNVEYNPSWYGAFAAGSVDYLFRDFIVQPGAVPKQNLVLGRFGWGDKEKQIFILTVYTGTKNSFGGNSTTLPTSAPMVNTMSILGYSLETKYKIDRNMDFSFEAAKSSSPYASGYDRSKSFNQAFSFSDRNNEALSAKFNLNIPATRSTFNLFYKEVGANFQSFSVFNSGNRQEGWGFKWRQYLFRNQLSLTLQIKKSAFDDPLIASTYSSSMLFKSLQMVYRKKKWPVFSVGYMPSTQLIRNTNGLFSENVYYALTAGVFYSYTFRKLRMNSSLLYNQFYNRGTDSGFILYNAKNIIYTHQVNWGKINSQSDVQYTTQPGLSYWMFQHRMDVTIGKCLTAGASVKSDLLPATEKTYWGGSLQLQIQFGRIGGLRMQYSKDYLPNGSNGLVPYNWGRANWIKVF